VDTVEARDGFRVAFVAVQGLDQQEVLSGLSLRVPDLETRTKWDISALGETRKQPGRQVFLSLRAEPGDPARVSIEVVTGDGRGFSRSVDAEPEDAREVTSMLANLLFSIEHERVEADVEDVALPETSATADIERVVATVEQALEAPPMHDPVAEKATEPAKEEVEPQPAKKKEAELEADASSTPSGIPPNSDGWSIGVPLHAGILLAMGGPAYAGLLQGGGPETGLLARSPKGALFGLRFRWGVRERVPFRVHRFRVALAAGYALRKNEFELPMSAELSLEPWFLQDDTEPVDPVALGRAESAAVLYGAGLRIEPGYLARVRQGPLYAVRLGATLAISGSFVNDHGPQVVGIRSDLNPDGSDELFRLGGAEAFLGAGVQLWFRLPVN
jgi:hypothetical protein